MVKYRQDPTFKEPRFSGISTFMRLPHVKTLENVDVAIIGIPFDTGQTFRTGARFGPQAIRNFSSLVRCSSNHHKINIFDYISAVDYGDIPVVPGFIQETYKNIVEVLAPMYKKEIVPIVMGGDHSISLGELRAAAEHYGPVSLVHFDAHTDTVDSYFGQRYTHGTPFRRAVEEGLIDPFHSIQIGLRGSINSVDEYDQSRELGFEVITTEEVLDMGIKSLISAIKHRVAGRRVFLSFDVDFIDPAFAPGTGTPEVGGIYPREAFQILRQLTDIPFIGFDVVEVLPAYDHGDITSALAANVMFEMMCLTALNKKEHT
ncbi:agmatinase [Bacillus thermophilus]|uniref:Agmatinase n=1 Tax=Siminovitchia thermophila TaxID=1245522 RepID=A0ABS2R3X5_9BACI|nr:agmatinase [Siminovitchia thermophila]MBM7714336.1 agmatinase [Siminovitchia thermophila]ONK22234.1 agmatinase [Bacillus sp. VT-16-64]